jgi:hypothetical protein
MSINSLGDGGEGKPVDIKIRPLYVDGRTKEFTVGLAHDVTEKTFVVQRIFRLNDSLPQENGPAHWRWEQGGWLLIDRVGGKVQPIALPEFDAYVSAVTWFRDYAAYCGISDDGQKTLTMIVQLGRRKPVLKKVVADAGAETAGCSSPAWQRDPVRVTFETKTGQKTTFAVKSRSAYVTIEDESASEE